MRYGRPSMTRVIEEVDGSRFVCAVVTVTGLGDLDEVREAFEQDWPVEVNLLDAPDDGLRDILDYLDGFIGSLGGELWEIDDSVLLLLPKGGPPGWSRRDLPDDGDLAGVREPRRPFDPHRSMRIELGPPDGAD